jgi:hypothetical protein
MDATASAALTMPSAVVVLPRDESKNLLERSYRWGPWSNDRRVALDKLCEAEAPVYAVITVGVDATSRNVTFDDRISRRFTSSCEVMGEGVARVREKIGKPTDDYFPGGAQPVEGTSIFQCRHDEFGDVEKAFRSVARVVRNPYSYESETT